MNKIILLSLLVLLLSCSKDEEILIPNTTAINQIPKLKAAYLGPYDFDWENSTNIMHNGNNIILPWCSGAPSPSIPKEICDDFKSSDGWVLLYNDFPIGQADPKFILYNKFKGIIKTYLYVTNSTYTSSSFTWGFGANTINCKTSSFNFTKNIPEPSSSKYSNPSAYVANYSSDPAAIPNGVNPNYWYCGQVEVMYDPDITSLSHKDIDFRLQCFATNKQYVKLDGSINGSITGTFTMPGAGGSSGLFSDLVESFKVNKIGSLNMPTLAEAKDFFGGYIADQTNSLLKSQLTSGLASLNTALTSSNPLINTITKGLLSTSSSTPGKINCSIKASISQKGTITNSLAGPGAIFKFPGTSSSNLGGILPNYDFPLGVFCIDNIPKIQVNQTSTWYNDDGGYYQVYNILTIDKNSFNIIINPEVRDLCSKITTSSSIIYSPTFHSYTTPSINGSLIDSSNGNFKYKGARILESYNGWDPIEVDSSQCMVRVQISLTPIDQSDPIIIIKEFAPTIVML